MGDVATLKWFHFDQNNSGGYFIVNDVVAEDVFIQEASAEEASQRAVKLFEPYSEYCECCGERWYPHARESEGYDVPTRYGRPITEQGPGLFRKQARLHHYDGVIETFFYHQPAGLLKSE